MKVLILAAGFCTRLFPVTECFPKALLPVGGREILSYILDDVVKNKLSDIALVTNTRYRNIFSVWLKSKYPNVSIRVIDNDVKNPEDRLGAIGDLDFALKQLNWYDDDLLILASDTLASLKLSNLLKFYQDHRGIVNTVFDTKDIEVIRKKLGCVITRGDKITEFVEKPDQPKSTLTSIPYYIYPKETLPLVGKYLKSGSSADAPGSIIAWMIGKVPCFAYRVDGYYYDVGTLEVLNRLNQNAELV